MRSPLHQQVDTLPDLVRATIDPFYTAVRHTITPKLAQRVERVYLTGCGDSHHAPLNAELAFEQLAGLPCTAMNAMQFARYKAGYLPERGHDTNLVIAVSVSGSASRTVEAMRMARQAKAVAVALTGNPNSALAAAAELIMETAVPPLPDELQGMIVPGTRSYVASQLSLYLCALQLGEYRGHLSKTKANQIRRELASMADLIEETIAKSDSTAMRIATDWQTAQQFVFCGSGPNYGTALFSAAKLLEASGDIAIAQDVEEWAHLQYFGREQATPTFIISAGGWDNSRALEVATAAKQIGRRVVIVAPTASALAMSEEKDFLLETAVSPRECFSPLLTCLPPTLFAACRAQMINEPYFRNFGCGRSIEGGGGISRIRESDQLESLNRDWRLV